MVHAALALAVMAFASAALAQPSPRFYVDMVYVPQVGKLLAFGCTLSGLFEGRGLVNELWVLDVVERRGAALRRRGGLGGGACGRTGPSSRAATRGDVAERQRHRRRQRCIEHRRGEAPRVRVLT